MNYESKIKLFLLLLIAYCLPLIASSAGIEVSPARLDLQVGPEIATAEITVANPTADVQVFEIYADDFAELFEFNPASFTLESGARKTIEIIISRNNETNSEILSTTISILATPLADSRVQTATGVKIPVSITTTGATQKEIPYPEIAGTIAGIAAVIYFSFFRSRKST